MGLFVITFLKLQPLWNFGVLGSDHRNVPCDLGSFFLLVNFHVLKLLLIP